MNVITATSGGIAVVLGSLVLLGWYLHVVVLVQVFPGLETTHGNTALSLLLSGAGLLFLNSGRRRLAIACGAAVSCIGALTLAEYLLGVDFGIDQLLIRGDTFTGVAIPVFPGRMSPTSAVCFVLIGAALFALSGKRFSHRQAGMTAALAATLILVLGSIAIAGYAFSIPTFGWWKAAAMSLISATGYSILGVGLGALAWRFGEPDPSGAPAWLPAAVAVGTLTASLFLWQALLAQERETAAATRAALSVIADTPMRYELEGHVLSGSRSALPEAFLTFGLFLSVLLPATTLLAQLARRRAKVAEAALRDREAEILERKRAEEKLHSSQEFVRHIIEATPNSLYIYDLVENRVVFANRQVAQVLGYMPEEFQEMGTNFIQRIFHPDDLDRIAEYLRQLVGAADGEVFEIDLRLRDKTGCWKWMHCRSVIFSRNPDGAGKQILGVAEDTTGRRQLEEQLRQAQKMEAVGQLAGGVAHDFNNMLTVINGYAHLVLDQLEPANPLRKSMEAIKKAGEHSASLTRQLLAFSRRQIFQPRVLSLNEIVRENGDMVRRLIGENVELIMALDPNLGPVEVDAAQIGQVIVNLAVNSRDAMPDGGKLLIETANLDLDEPLIRAEGQMEAGMYAVLTVSDTGVGMDTEILRHIFEPFFTTKGQEKGTGLGLSTVYGTVKQSGGEISVYSEPGRGTTFRVYLPCVREERLASAPVKPVEPRRVGGTETVLLVEDEAPVRTLIRGVLSEQGYNVLEARDGNDALRVSAECDGPIHLMITDMVMPGMNGHELARRMEQLRPHMRVLHVSGYTDAAEVHRGILEKGLHFLQKPFTPGALCGKVRGILDEPRPAGSILVVDDDAGIRQLLLRTLEESGYNIAEAGDGRQALAQLQRSPADLVIVDLVMPEQDGIELIQAIRGSYPKVKLIAISGAFQGQFLGVAKLLGADAALQKPFRTDEFLKTVQRLLQG